MIVARSAHTGSVLQSQPTKGTNHVHPRYLGNRRQFLKGSVVAGAAVAAGGVVGGLAPATAKADGVPSKWNKEVDVVIVGTGHSGLAAAITATDAGAKVVMLEKMKKEFEGGNSKVSGNMWWTPTDLAAGPASTSAA